MNSRRQDWERRAAAWKIDEFASCGQAALSLP